MNPAVQQLDDILDQLVREVEAGVHAFYRGEHKQNTVRTKGDQFRKVARDALLPLLASSGSIPTPRPGGTLGAMGGGASGNLGLVSPDEIAAITRCIMGWLPMGPPSAASAQSRCVPAAKELAPSWGEREKARNAVKRSTG